LALKAGAWFFRLDMTVLLVCLSSYHICPNFGEHFYSLDTCLAPDAKISDVGENDKIAGVAAIKEFIKDSREKFKLHAAIQSVDNAGEKIKVTTLTSGDFPTSPQYFHYEFILAGGLIKNIDILPGEANVQ